MRPELNGHSVAVAIGNIHDRFAWHAASAPGAQALVVGDAVMTYGELDAAANRLARHLTTLGVGPDDRVALYLDRSVDFAVGLLAALKSGGAFVPLDLAHPTDRLNFLISDAAPRVVVTRAEWLDRVPTTVPHVVALDRDAARMAGYDGSGLSNTAAPHHLAYQMYTSGSTGRPKGVLVEHAQVVSYAKAIAARLSLAEGDRFGLVSSLATDLGYTSIFGAFATGGCLVMSPRTGMDAEALAAYFTERPIDVLKIAPTHLRAVLPSPGARFILPRKTLVVGGEALTWDLVDRVRTLAPDLAIHNHYGPTETTVGVVTCRVDETAARRERGVPLGTPLAHATIHVVTRHMQLAPIGVKGEICIGGAGVARGYAGASGGDDRFVADPFTGTDHGRLYRTGDMGRILPDGTLEFLGRLDSQVKIRGYRVEPAEVEAAIAAHPDVVQAAVVAHDHALAGARLAAYVVLAAPAAVSQNDLKRFVAERLPEYMVPSSFTRLDRLPLSASGKIDRVALPAPAPPEVEPPSTVTAPRTPAEQALADIWQQVLGLPHVSAHDTFLALGGDSIQAIQLAARATQAGFTVKLEELFTDKSLAAFAADTAAVLAPASVTAITPIVRPAAGQFDSDDPVEDTYPLSPMQQAMLLHSVSIATAGEYLEQKRVRLPRSVDAAALQQAWNQTIARNPILRTAFVWGIAEEPRQVVYRKLVVPLAEQDLRALVPADQDAHIGEHLQAERREPRADLSRLPLIRLTLFRLSDDTFELVWTHHNALLDGWSADLILREVKAHYEIATGSGSPEPRANRPYRDYIDWLATQDESDAEAFWRRTLRGVVPQSLPIIEPDSPPGAAYHDGYGQQERRLSIEATARLREFARERQLTLHTVVMGAWALLLSIYTREHEVVFGSVLSGRDADVPGAELIAGPLINVVPIRTAAPADAPITPWLQQLQASHFALRPFGHIPLRVVTDWSGLTAGQTLFDSVLVFNNHPLLDEVSWSSRNRSSQQTGVPIHMVVEPGSELTLLCTYRRDHLGHAAIARVLDHFSHLLDDLTRRRAATLGELSMLARDEIDRLLAALSGPVAAYPSDRTFAQLFQTQASRTPDARAIRAGDATWTYATLDRASNAIAHAIDDAGLTAGSVVAVIASRGPQLAAAMIGAFTARATCLPLDPGFPPERLSRMLVTAGASLVLCDREWMDVANQANDAVMDAPRPIAAIEDVLAAPPRDRRSANGDPDDAAYILFTSGSTGRPKGAIVEQRGMMNHLFAKVDTLGLTPADTVAQTAPVSFDIFVWQLLAPLLVGGVVSVFENEVTIDPQRLLVRADDDGVTVLETVPSVLRVVLEELARPGQRRPELARLRWLVLTGEALPADLCRQWLARYPHIPIVNAYGPTECSDDVTHQVVETPPAAHLHTVPIGRPLPNIRLYVVDPALRLLPAGVQGELCVGGVCVGRGYVNDPKRTAEVFVRDPFAAEPGGRLYRTGDMVRLLADGTLDFLGRSDTQIKIHGVRIELGEIEVALREHPAVIDAVVVVDRAHADPRLVAYVVANERLSLTPAELRYILGKMLPDYVVPPIFSLLDTMPDRPLTLTSQDLRYHVAKTLPEYMVPSSIVFLKDIPLTPNGKVDRQSLPSVEGDAERPETAGIIGPRTATEASLMQIWSELLGVTDFSVEDNFFRLGGNSLRATQLMLRVRDEMQVDVPIHATFESPTIVALAERIDASRMANGGTRHFSGMPDE